MWTVWDRVINIGGLIAWMAVGTLVLFAHNQALPYIFLIYFLAVLALHLYLACSRCVHYGQNCYALGGRVSKILFPPRKVGPKEPDDSIQAALWFFLIMLPAPFLLYYQDWVLLAIYILVSFGWYLQHKYTACVKCKNDWCPVHPSKRR